MLALRDSPFVWGGHFYIYMPNVGSWKGNQLVLIRTLVPLCSSRSMSPLQQGVWLFFYNGTEKKFVKVFEQIFLSRCITTCNLTHSIAAVSWTPRVGATPNKFPFTAQAWGAYALQSWTKGMSRLMTELFWHLTNLGFVALWISCSNHLLSERQKGSKFENVNIHEVNKWKNISKLEFDSPE